MIRELQPGIMINDRLEWPQFSWHWRNEGPPPLARKDELGDFGTPEQCIFSRPGYLWESCQTSRPGMRVAGEGLPR